MANRVQSRFTLLLIPLEDFVEPNSLVGSTDITWQPLIQLYEEEDAQYWIEVRPQLSRQLCWKPGLHFFTFFV
ncbi:unnamed protein product [Dibothriocephalus latus]|uniref:Uncharacterized protein n=1 Tax=Dibothriocephalus latus TaxID=60516 RepID=A0A3P7MUY4_DIBLA|nr:unnamed protein product [Dibothriocephalus latus]